MTSATEAAFRLATSLPVRTHVARAEPEAQSLHLRNSGVRGDATESRARRDQVRRLRPKAAIPPTPSANSPKLAGRGTGEGKAPMVRLSNV